MPGIYADYAFIARLVLLLLLALGALTAAPAQESSAAADQVSKDAAPMASPSGPQTLTGDWFGQGPALRNAGFDFRLEWSQFYQGMTRGWRTLPTAGGWPRG